MSILKYSWINRLLLVVSITWLILAIYYFQPLNIRIQDGGGRPAIGGPKYKIISFEHIYNFLLVGCLPIVVVCGGILVIQSFKDRKGKATD